MLDLVIGYDGSEEADQAIAVAARALTAARALVVNAWYDPDLLTAGPLVTPAGAAALPLEQQSRLERAAAEIAESGAASARALGLHATAATCRATSHAHIGHALVDVAHQHGAGLLVVGRSGGSILKEAVLGSVSGTTVRDGRLPVLVVPGA